MKNNKLKNFIGELIAKVVAKEMTEWPPECALLFYQPERPKQQENNK